MLKRAYKNGANPEWVTADSVYGDKGKFCLCLEKKNQFYVLSVRSNHNIIPIT